MMATALVRERVTVEHGQRSLEEALAELGIDPFTRESAERYQADKARQATPWLTRWLTETYDTIELTLGLLFVGSVLIAGASIVGSIVCLFFTTVPTWLMLAIGGCLCITAASVSAIVWVGGRDMRVAEWVLIPMEIYHGPIPEFAEQTATDLKERYPEAKFMIAELRWREVRLDPFLIVFGRTCRYYLEVWNEPGFTKKRQV